MTTLSYYYFIIAISGAIMANYYICSPILEKMKSTEGLEEHTFVTSPIITRFVFFIVSIIILPFLIKPLLDEESKNAFIDGIIEGATLAK